MGTMKIESTLWKVIDQAVHESVANLTVPANEGKVEITAGTLKVILYLLEFHPKALVRKTHIQSVQELLTGNQISWTPEQLSAMKVLQVSEKPRSANDV